MLRIGLLIFALVAGGGAAWVALQMSRDPAADKTTVQRPVTAMQDVLVAAADLGIGRALNTCDGCRCLTARLVPAISSGRRGPMRWTV